MGCKGEEEIECKGERMKQRERKRAYREWGRREEEREKRELLMLNSAIFSFPIFLSLSLLFLLFLAIHFLLHS